MRKGGNHKTTTDYSETETPQGSIMLAEMQTAG